MKTFKISSGVRSLITGGISCTQMRQLLGLHSSEYYVSVQFSSLLGPIMSSGGGGRHEGQFSRDPLPVFSAGGPCGQFWRGQGCPLFDVVHPAFPLPITASPTFQGALKDVSGEAVVACDMPEPCKFLSLNDSCLNHRVFLTVYTGQTTVNK